jgi:endonuclease-3
MFPDGGLRMERKRAMQILGILKSDFSVPRLTDSARDPFKALIRTVLSQNTADVNSMRAFKSLSEKFPITPEALAEADVNEIEKAIRVAGLYKNKSRVIKNLSSIILEKFGGSLDFIYSLSLEEARKTLLGLPGVGPKTADVVLIFCAGKPTLPIDTHVNRVSKRLGLVPPKADYEEVRRALQALYPAEEYLSVHLLLISLGRKYCKARKPLCNVCPVNALCPSRRT